MSVRFYVGEEHLSDLEARLRDNCVIGYQSGPSPIRRFCCDPDGNHIELRPLT